MRGRDLKKIIRERFGTQTAFAKAADIPDSTLTMILKNEVIDGRNAERIQKAMDVKRNQHKHNKPFMEER